MPKRLHSFRSARMVLSPGGPRQTALISTSNPATPDIHDQVFSSPLCGTTNETSRADHISHPLHVVSNYLNYAMFALLPILAVGPQPTLAEQDVASATATDPLSWIKSLQGNPTLDRILGTTVIVLLVYVTIGAIIITIDGIIIRRNDKREREWVRKRVEGEPYPKTIWSPEIDTEFPPKSTSGASSTAGLNREQRRIEKKIQTKEEKEKKRREARGASKKKDNGDK
ncbi:unnamed protein product [Agarophyton chilense]